jgi:ribosomal protein L9
MTHKIQIDDLVRDATPEEAAVIDAQRAEAAQAEADRKAKEQARAAVLTKLGLTADEAAALLG